MSGSSTRPSHERIHHPSVFTKLHNIVALSYRTANHVWFWIGKKVTNHVIALVGYTEFFVPNLPQWKMIWWSFIKESSRGLVKTFTKTSVFVPKILVINKIKKIYLDSIRMFSTGN